MTETLKLVLSILGTSLAWVSLISTLVVKQVKSNKLKKIASQLNFFTDQAQKYVSEAEKFLNYSGKDKKEYVMTKVNQAAIDNKVKFDKETVSSLIEKIVDITKNVNKREKDKGKELE